MVARLGFGSVIDDDVDRILREDLPWERLAGKSVLVTGANGMLPSYVVLTLLALNDAVDAGVTVRGLVRNEDKARRLLGPILDRDDFGLVVSDVADLGDLDGPLDLVVHGASAARPQLHATDPVATMKANVIGSFKLLDQCVGKGAEGFILMSSSEIYGDQPDSVDLISEQSYGGFDILNPRACYSEGKRAAETIASLYAHQYSLRSLILRFGHVYGPLMALDDGRVQADFAANVVRREDIVLNSDGRAMRTYTYVADAVSGLFHGWLLGERLVYNVADPAGMIAIRDLAVLFTEARPESGLKRVFAKSEDASPSFQGKRLGLDSSALEAVGWVPRVPLRVGIDRMIASLEGSG